MTPDASYEQSPTRLERRHLGPFTVAPVRSAAMPLTGPGSLGTPRGRAAAIAVLREAVDRGVDPTATAQYYGPAVVNELTPEGLPPSDPGLVLATKVGARPDSRGVPLL